jgi:hypothetical protein
MNFFKRRKILIHHNSLDLIPVRICGHDEVDGRVIILAPKFSRLMNIFFPQTQMLFFRIKLDETGSVIWKQIDGILNIYEVTEQSLAKLDKSKDLSGFQERVSRFMTMLYDRRYITFKQLLDEA